MGVLSWLIGYKRNESGHLIQAVPGMELALNIPIVSLFLVRSLPQNFGGCASCGTFFLLGMEISPEMLAALRAASLFLVRSFSDFPRAGTDCYGDIEISF